jgi:hypothetical protein
VNESAWRAYWAASHLHAARVVGAVDIRRRRAESLCVTSTKCVHSRAIDQEVFQYKAAFTALQRCTATPARDFTIGERRIGSNTDNPVLSIAGQASKLCGFGLTHLQATQR